MLKLAIREDRYLNIELNAQLTGKVMPEDQRMIRELVLGVAERRLYLESVLEELLHQPLQKNRLAVRVILLMGAYQILFMPWIPDHASVYETVSLAKKNPKTNHASPMINAVLRKILAKREELLDDSEASFQEKALFLGFPLWMANLWRKQYDEKTAVSLMESMGLQRGVTIRANRKKGSVKALREELRAAEFEVSSLTYSPSGLHVEHASELSESAAYQEGRFSIQDESAMLVGDIISLPVHARILDLCAAPGGKSFHLAEKCPDCELVSNDIFEKKVERMQGEANRLGIDNCTFTVRDAEKLHEDWIGAFDFCLVDAPCSALGLIGRKPEIKSLRKPEDLDEIIEIQRRILTQAAQYLKPGGTLIYATCTLNRKENEKQVAWLCEESDLSVGKIAEPIPAARMLQEEDPGMITLMPHMDGMNGFFIAVLRKEPI